MSDFPAFTADLITRARAAGWEVLDEKTIPYGRQFHLGQPGGVKAVLSCYYGKKGFKFVPGGKAGADLAATLGGQAPSRPGTASGGSADPFGLGAPRLGADESGKGDYFGPLVTAAYRIEEGEAESLRALRVTDSKALADGTIERIAGKLEETGRGEVEVLMPREYNPRYAEVRNINTLLSQMHGACLRRLHERTGPVGVVIVDQYTPRTEALERAAHLPPGCRLVTRTKGEADPAVAAASILARAAFVQGLRDLSHEFGMTLPPGAGSPVLKAGRSFLRTFPREALLEVAKVHFATSDKI
ncbi:MAG: ribonuclease HIII [Planctomycetota bacterium]|nr:ribonuclease HIII [Planctomycetota bacterium]